MGIKVDKEQKVKTCQFKDLDVFSLYLNYNPYGYYGEIDFTDIGSYSLKVNYGTALDCGAGSFYDVEQEEIVVPTRSVMTVYPSESGINL